MPPIRVGTPETKYGIDPETNLPGFVTTDAATPAPNYITMPEGGPGDLSGLQAHAVNANPLPVSVGGWGGQGDPVAQAAVKRLAEGGTQVGGVDPDVAKYEDLAKKQAVENLLPVTDFPGGRPPMRVGEAKALEAATAPQRNFQQLMSQRDVEQQALETQRRTLPTDEESLKHMLEEPVGVNDPLAKYKVEYNQHGNRFTRGLDISGEQKKYVSQLFQNLQAEIDRKQQALQEKYQYSLAGSNPELQRPTYVGSPTLGGNSTTPTHRR